MASSVIVRDQTLFSSHSSRSNAKLFLFLSAAGNTNIHTRLLVPLSFLSALDNASTPPENDAWCYFHHWACQLANSPRLRIRLVRASLFSTKYALLGLQMVLVS